MAYPGLCRSLAMRYVAVVVVNRQCKH